MTAIARAEPQSPPHPRTRVNSHTTGLPWLLATELGASVAGFVVIMRWARMLDPSAFANVEYAAAVTAWLLVLVRGGVEVIVYREAARRPQLIRSLTENLIGLRCACAVIGYSLVLAVAWTVGRERGGVIAVAGLALVPSAFVADVGLRAAGRLGWIAFAQAMRACGYAAAGLCFVSAPSHAMQAAACGVLGELAGWVVPFAQHSRIYGFPKPRFRRRAWVVLARRGAIASLIRFGRVSVYAADLLFLGWWANAALGPYAAARRLVFALVALGLVVPASVAPAIARGWMAGASQARVILENMSILIWSLALPAAVGLALTAQQWMPLLFGARYGGGAIWLALVAARLPWLLSASLAQSALVSCRREMAAMRLVFAMFGLTALLMPVLAAGVGPAGVASAAFVVEVAGAIGGWMLLNRLGVAATICRSKAAAVAGSAVLVIVCLVLRGQPLALVCLAGAATYAATWAIVRRWEHDGSPQEGCVS